MQELMKLVFRPKKPLGFPRLLKKKKNFLKVKECADLFCQTEKIIQICVYILWLNFPYVSIVTTKKKNLHFFRGRNKTSIIFSANNLIIYAFL